MKLKDKVALITGGSEGIGFGIARAFVDAGAQTILFGRSQTKIDQAIDRLGPLACGFTGDATNLDSLDALYADISARFGHLDIVVANAGMAVGSPFLETTENSFDEHFSLNVKGVYFALQKAVPLLRRPASLIITGSTSGKMGLVDVSVYAATKAAVRSLARNISVEHAEDNIRCNVLSPGFTQSPLLTDLMSTPEGKERIEAWIANKVPMKRIATVAELGAAALFLASEDSSFVTGIELHVDGGMAQI